MDKKCKKQSGSIEELSWESARTEVSKVNRAFAKIIDKISPDKHHTLIKINYSFGDILIQNGELHLPSSDGNLYPFSHMKLEKFLKDKFTYSTIPLLLTLKNCNEVFINTGTRIIPLNFIKTFLMRKSVFIIHLDFNALNQSWKKKALNMELIHLS